MTAEQLKSPNEQKRKVDELVTRLKGLMENPKTIEEAEKYRKKISKRDPIDLLEEFTI